MAVCEEAQHGWRGGWPCSRRPRRVAPRCIPALAREVRDLASAIQLAKRQSWDLNPELLTLQPTLLLRVPASQRCAVEAQGCSRD